MKPLNVLRSRTAQPWARPAVSSRHREWSVISSQDDQPQASPQLIELACEAARLANVTADPAWYAEVPAERQTLLRTWPGEHYRLLIALTTLLHATEAVEVGTDTGLAALCMAAAGASVVTYDVVPHASLKWSALRELQVDAQVEQRLMDLSDPATFEAQLPTLASAQLLFVDGPKDSVFEQRFLPKLAGALAGTGVVLMLDDIRLLNMVALWRELPGPKLDVTSFGHWSGTGLIQL